MVAHVNSFCKATTTSTPTRPAAFAVVAPRSSSRNTKTGNGKKTRTGRRRCMEPGEVIERKMEALRRLVPTGGDGDHHSDETEDDGVDELLFRAADYIVRLQVQVRAMQLMVDVLEEHTKHS
uniref:Uncharacterized protein n=1 Tax=Avena sativa TaxID=4498 RepID=A0ACD5TX02_AVESA